MAQSKTSKDCKTFTLFGGDEYVPHLASFAAATAVYFANVVRGWDATDWTQSDDSVRGGQSEVCMTS